MVRKAAVVAVCLTLLSQPVVADGPADPAPLSEDRFEIEDVGVYETDDSAELTVEYDVSLSVRIDVFLFGSGSIEETVLDRLELEPSDVEFDDLDTSSAELSYDGEPDELDAVEG